MKVQELVRIIIMKGKINQSELSRATGIDKGSLSTYLSGKRKPGILNKARLIDAAKEYAGIEVNYEDIED